MYVSHFPLPIKNNKGRIKQINIPSDNYYQTCMEELYRLGLWPEYKGQLTLLEVKIVDKATNSNDLTGDPDFF